MKIYKGLEVDDGKILGEAHFTVFGEMADHSRCYHKVVDGEEIEDGWYSCCIIGGRKCFIYEGR